MSKITPASIRNRNPGAMYPGPSAKKFGSTAFETLRSKDGVHKIATFATEVHGAAAMFDLLHRSYRGMPIEKAIAKWCGGYYVSTYLKVLQEKTGTRPSDVLTDERLRNPDIAVPLAKAMAWQEAGREFPLDDDGWREAHGLAFGNARAPAFDPSNDVPAPKPETRAAQAASEVAKVAVPVAGTTGALTVPNLPAPPDLSVLSSWQAFATGLQEIVTWAAGSWPWVAAAAGAYVLLGHVMPAMERFRT